MILPLSFVESVRQLLGHSTAEAFLAALEQEPSTSIRLNPLKQPQEMQLPIEAVPWSTHGYYLTERPRFTFDPLLHAGAYYVQEASSMFVEQAVRTHVHGAVCALDLCAAPGGKSTLLRSCLPEGSLLVANEYVRSRANILAENLTKWGHPDVVVTQTDAATLGELTNAFDLILADVPCSGEGMFRKDAEAVDEWSEEAVAACVARQRRILTDVWPALKPGGILIYSTCTYNTNENESNVGWACQELGAEALPIPTAEGWQVGGGLPEGEKRPVYRFLPHRTRGEGFFLAVLRKQGGEEEAANVLSAERERPKKTKKSGRESLFTIAQRAEVETWLQPQELVNRTMVEHDEGLHLLPTAHLDLCQALARRCHVMLYGTRLATLKGRDLQPAHALALSATLLHPDALPTASLSYEQAIAYLGREALTLPASTARGWVRLCFRGLSLGWGKQLGTRTNNLYPQEWRIRSTHRPEAEERVI